MKEKVIGTKTHKSFLMKLIRDERFSPRMRYQCELILMRLDKIIPIEIIDSILIEEFGTPNRLKRNPEELSPGEIMDKKVITDLKESWKNIISEENDAISHTTDS